MESQEKVDEGVRKVRKSLVLGEGQEGMPESLMKRSLENGKFQREK